MAWLDKTPEELRTLIAAMLGCDTEQPDMWPDEVIDRILGEADKATDRCIREAVMRANGAWR